MLVCKTAMYTRQAHHNRFLLEGIKVSGLIRTEKDFIGEKAIPENAYYGIQTMRAVENFPITGVPIEKELITALAAVKKSRRRCQHGLEDASSADRQCHHYRCGRSHARQAS